MVSVVIPVYNGAAYLTDALDSALFQTFQPSEILVIDDGSTDQSAALAESYGGIVRVIRQPQNLGAGAAKDAGLRAAQYPLVAFLDADDLWVPMKLAIQVPHFDNPDVALSYGRAVTFTGDFTKHSAPWPTEIPTGRVLEAFYFACVCPNSTVIVRRDVAIQLGGFDASAVPCEDYDLWLRIAMFHEVAASPLPLMGYREHGAQLSANFMRSIRQHVAVETAHAEQFCALTGFDEVQRQQRALKRLLVHVECALYARQMDRVRALVPFIFETYRYLTTKQRRHLYGRYVRACLPPMLYRWRDRRAA